MLLAVDVGNTEITIGVFQDDELAQHGGPPPWPSAPPTSTPCCWAGSWARRGWGWATPAGW